jgi:hypothetical protein
VWDGVDARCVGDSPELDNLLRRLFATRINPGGWIVTTSELAFGTAALTAAISALATLLTYKNARESSREQRRNLQLQLDHERRKAADARIWEERRDIYVELLIWLQDLTDVSPGPDGPSPEEWQRHRIMWAKVAAFGSPEIQTLRDDAEAAMLEWRTSVAYQDVAAGEVPDGVASYESASEKGWRVLRQTADAIRKELGAADQPFV